MQFRSSSQHRQQGSEGSGRHAVVVGGSIGGMLAARVLSDHFDRITLIERDHLPEGTANRPGVPQARHLHFFLKRGLMAIEELFPGVKPDLLAAGSQMLDQGKDFRILYRSGWSPKVACNLEICTFTRPLLEEAIRRHLLQDPKISIAEGCEVSALVLDESGERVSGVRIRRRGTAETGEETTLHADFVVDVSGRGSKAPEWLQALGYEAPEETVVDAFWGYATRIYEPVEGFSADWKSLFVLNRPPYQPRAGIIQPIEGNRWIVTVAGVMHDYPPTDEEGFLKFAKSLSSPELYRAISAARPLSKIWGYRQTANRLRHYEKLTRMPQGFVTMGDAVCSFNPVYALGMTLTCLAALELRDSLRKGHGQVETPAVPEAARQAGGRLLGAHHGRGPALARDAGRPDHGQGEVHALVHRAGDPADPPERGGLPPLPGGQPHAEVARRPVPPQGPGAGAEAGVRWPEAAHGAAADGSGPRSASRDDFHRGHPPLIQSPRGAGRPRRDGRHPASR